MVLLFSLWCDRCERSFRSYESLWQHLRDSSRHWECPGQCGEDCHTRDDLLQHCREGGCCHVCQDCNGGLGYCFVDNEKYWDHVDDYNVSTACERHFDSPDNLFQHELSHRGFRYECLKCDGGFKTYGGMIIHLESGCCSDVDIQQLNAIAAECYSADEFIFQDYQWAMIYSDLEHCHGRVRPYFCPACDTTMSKLSSLFQHVESRSCSQTLDDGPIGVLRDHLACCV